MHVRGEHQAIGIHTLYIYDMLLYLGLQSLGQPHASSRDEHAKGRAAHPDGIVICLQRARYCSVGSTAASLVTGKVEPIGATCKQPGIGNTPAIQVPHKPPYASAL